MKTNPILAVALACTLALTILQTQTVAQEKAAPAAEQSAYATAVEAYIRFLPRFYTFGFEKLMTGEPDQTLLDRRPHTGADLGGR